MQTDVAIIGGGISGLAAGVDLSARGYRVAVLEQRGRLGGRAYSYVDKASNDVIDNGQHLLLGGFHSTMRFLYMLGAQTKVRVQRNLEVVYYHPWKGFIKFRCPSLPNPLHVIVGILTYRALSIEDRLRLLLMLKKLTSRNQTAEIERSLTVDEWLSSCRQSEECKKYFWNPIAIATLNDDPKRASARLFAAVLRRTFAMGRESGVLILPKTGLSELYVDDACSYIEKRGGEIKKNVRVTKLLISDGVLLGVECVGGRRFSGRAFVSAAPLHDLVMILPKGIVQSLEYMKNGNRDLESTIITINLWFNRQVMEEEFVGLLDSPIHWVFNKSRIFSNDGRGGCYLACVISGAGEMRSWKNEQLVDLALGELSKAYPVLESAKLLRSIVVREKRATLSASPVAQALRLGARTALKNFFLAGDWTDTGLPPTLESAVASGFKASELVDQYLKSS
jgi:squalene-associated FAD-dependent desaturase